jgi:hypothetical protein
VRVECESCRELVAASFAIEGDTVRATCSVCRHVMASEASRGAELLAARGPGDVPEPPAPADALCPKCGTARPDDATACSACGLAVDRMPAYIDTRDAAVPAPVREAWAHATAGWSDEARHDDLLREVASHNSYAWAAGRYRTRGGDAIAQRQLDRLRRAAEATLRASATARPGADTRPYRGTAGVLAVLIVVIVIGLFYAVVIRDHPAPRPLVPGHPVSPSTIK